MHMHGYSSVKLGTTNWGSSTLSNAVNKDPLGTIARLLSGSLQKLADRTFSIKLSFLFYNQNS